MRFGWLRGYLRSHVTLSRQSQCIRIFGSGASISEMGYFLVASWPEGIQTRNQDLRVIDSCIMDIRKPEGILPILILVVVDSFTISQLLEQKPARLLWNRTNTPQAQSNRPSWKEKFLCTNLIDGMHGFAKPQSTTKPLQRR